MRFVLALTCSNFSATTLRARPAYHLSFAGEHEGRTGFRNVVGQGRVGRSPEADCRQLQYATEYTLTVVHSWLWEGLNA